MTAFADSLATLHADPNMADAASYRRPPWPWAPARIIRTAPNEIMGGLGGPGARAGYLYADVLTAALAYTPVLGGLVRGGGAAGDPGDGAAGMAIPVRGPESGKCGHERDATHQTAYIFSY